MRLLVFEKNHSTSHEKVGHQSGVFFPRTGRPRLLGICLLGLAMFSVAGGHWAVLQTVAWAQMLRDYSKDATMVEAVEKTFSGEAPCSMCKLITKARQQEEKAPATVKVDKKAEVFVTASKELLPLRVSTSFSYPSMNLLDGPVRFDSPPIPVPRAAFLSLA